MIIDETNGFLLETILWAKDEDKKTSGQAVPESGVQSPILMGLLEKLEYLQTYNTTVHPAGAEDQKVVPSNCLVTLFKSRDCGDHSFDLLWHFKTGEAKKSGLCHDCLDMAQGAPSRFSPAYSTRGRRCERCYRFFMNGGLVFHQSDNTWGVHT